MMKSTGTTRMNREASILSFLVACALAVGLSAYGSRMRNSDHRANADNEFAAFLPKYDEAIREFAKGRPAKVKSLWSRRPDVTLVGGFGGAVHHGWDDVSARQDWASSQYIDGTVAMEEVTRTVTADLAYIVRIEHFRFRAPDKPEELTQDLRVTVVFRREPEGWRVVHRHADQQTTRQSPR
jgi:ketosteroid isomerase-like protein